MLTTLATRPRAFTSMLFCYWYRVFLDVFKDPLSYQFLLHARVDDYQTHITPASFQNKALKKLVQEFNFLRAHCVEPLSTFLDYITCVLRSSSF